MSASYTKTVGVNVVLRSGLHFPLIFSEVKANQFIRGWLTGNWALKDRKRIGFEDFPTEDAIGWGVDVDEIVMMSTFDPQQRQQQMQQQQGMPQQPPSAGPRPWQGN